MIDALSQTRVADSILRFLILLLLLIALPHAANLSSWLFVFLAGAVAWRLAAIAWPRLMPGRWTLVLLMLLGIGNVVLNVNLFDGRLLGTALLIVMLGLKLLELRSRRDVYVCVYLGFFLALTQFLFHQNLWLAVYLFTLSGMLGSLLVMLNRVHLDTRRSLVTSALILISAAPAMLALFLFFPRLENPLWAIEIDKPTGVVGISDQMQMGSIGELSQSGATAFRVRFNGEAPLPAQRYWRGLVLWKFDGRTWKPSPSIRRPQELQVNGTTRIDYEMTLEASHQPWVFALDMPGSAPDPLILNDDLRLVAPEAIKERSTFQLSSYTGYRANGLSHRQKNKGLALPSSVSDRTRDLAERWRNEAGSDDRAIVQAALDHFRQQPFVYTLTPGASRGDPVDTFLFESRRGFCEHYAGSFAVLMRLAGIPTRVVVGYQGGEFNPRAGHWLIKQSDAHAWAEVWLQDGGWTRIDPTAAVAPERIEQSIDTAKSTANGEVVFKLPANGMLSDLVREAGWMLDAVEIGWHRWVLGFSHARQTSLLESLGFSNLRGYEYALIIAGILALSFVFTYAISVLRKRPRTDPVLAQWQKLVSRMQRKGLNIPPWYGPEQVLEAATERWPQQSKKLKAVVQLYIHLRYGQRAKQRERAQFQRAIKRLKFS